MTGEGGGGEGGSGEGGLVRSQAIRLRSAARCERGGVPRVPRVRPRAAHTFDPWLSPPRQLGQRRQGARSQIPPFPAGRDPTKGERAPWRLSGPHGRMRTTPGGVDGYLRDLDRTLT